MKDLEKARAQIDKIDKKIVELLADRTDIVYEIALYKRKNNILTKDEVREAEIYKRIREIARDNNVSQKFISNIYKVIFEYCRGIQRIRD